MKRLRLSERDMITLRPRRISSRQSSGSGWRATIDSRLPAMDLIGVSELFSSWPSTRIREHGLPLELVVIADLTQALREQELQAWQRLVRVLGHELNNSLTPIKSIAGSLESILARDPPPDDWRDDMRRGLNVITSRSESLSRFIGAYARLAKLPRPQPQPLGVAE